MPKANTKFGDAFTFDVPTSERVNGRLAIVGFVAAMGAEIWRVWEKFETNGSFMRMVVRMAVGWGGGSMWCSFFM